MTFSDRDIVTLHDCLNAHRRLPDDAARSLRRIADELGGAVAGLRVQATALDRVSKTTNRCIQILSGKPPRTNGEGRRKVGGK